MCLGLWGCSLGNLIFAVYKSLMMKQNKFPHSWDEKQVQQVIDHHEKQTEDEATDISCSPNI